MKKGKNQLILSKNYLKPDSLKTKFEFMPISDYPRTLLLATTSYAGMGPYIASIVNSFSPTDDVRFFLVEREDKYFSRNIHSDLRPMCTIVSETTPSKIKTLYQLTINGNLEYADKIKQVCKADGIEVVHALTSLPDVDLTSYLASHYNLIYTIHDLHPHEAKKAFYRKWRQDVLYKRIFKAIERSKYLYTNSLSQLEEQQKLYPTHKSFYTPFPSLITEEIAEGTLPVPELAGIKDYILFFGRIEAYKGLDTLVRAFNSSQLPASIKLVIAGKGEFVLEKQNENIIFINRYIDDREIAEMYRNASCVVYPYISATQSGVLSVASFFGTPIIASELPFFKEVLGADYPYLFPAGDHQALAEKLKRYYAEKSTDVEQFSRNLYNEKYSLDKLKDNLLNIYSEVFKHSSK